jgi:peptidyl-prolyl cis-trans isomerase D
MLDNLRANKGGIITYVFLFAIIIVFVVSFGPGSFDKGCTGAQGPVWAAKVNGQIIPATDYERGYQNLLRGFQQQAGQAFTRELAEQLGLASMAMNQLVERELVIQEAKRQGLVVPDEELAKTIFALPSFQTDGRFDKELYQRTVTSVYGSPSRFETVLREDLLYQRLMAGLRETVKVSDAEVKQAWAAEHDKVSLAFVRFAPAAAEAEVKKPTDAEVAAFAAKEGARIEKAYQEAAARFDQPKKVHARHILVRAAADAPAAESQAARQKLEALAARVQKGEDFAKVAAEASQDEGTKAKGGDLGFIAEGLVEKPFADAAFALKQGAVSEPVRTGSGWHLIKAEEVVEARKIPLEAARTDLARELLVKDRGAALLEQRAAAALAAVKAGKSLADLFPSAEAAKKAKKQPVTIGGLVVAADSTGPFSESGPFIPKLGAVPGLAATALATPAGQALPSVISTPQGPVVAVVESREKPDPARFDAEREAMATRLRNRRESQVQQAWLKKLRDAADVKINAAITAQAAAPGRDG